MCTIRFDLTYTIARLWDGKGIGKLSLLSIADTVEVQTFKGNEKNGFVMSVQNIRETDW